MRVFNANVSGGQVFIGGNVVPGCPILGNGGDSSGILVISQSELAYIPNTTPDLSQNIDIMIAAINGAINALNAISSGVLASNGGGAITTGTFATGIQAGVQELQTAIENLNALKGVLK